MTARWVMAALLSLLVFACNENKSGANNAAASNSGNATTAAASQNDMTPEQLGELGAKIAKEPDQAKQLLSASGLDEKSFEMKIRKVTEDPEASKRYAAAYQKGKA